MSGYRSLAEAFQGIASNFPWSQKQGSRGYPSRRSGSSFIFVLLILLMPGMRIGGAELKKCKAEPVKCYGFYCKEFLNAAVEAGIPVAWVEALAGAESDHRSWVVSSSGAIGLLQLKPATALEVCGATRAQLFDPAINARCGALYLAAQYRRFRSLRLALHAYSAGPGATARWLRAGGVGFPTAESRIHYGRFISRLNET